MPSTGKNSHESKCNNKDGNASTKCEEKTEFGEAFINLLWDDILFSKILPHLTLKDLFILRGLSSQYKLMMDSYFQQKKCLNLGPYSSIFSAEAFQVLSGKCSHLRTFIATKCHWLNDALLIPLFENNPHLTKIVLNRCVNLSSVCLQPVIINCKDLKVLMLAGCSWLTVGCLESITLHQRNLISVDFSECDNISLTAVNNFLSLSKSLKSLNLSRLDCVDDTTLHVIAHNAKELETLNIRNCHNISTHGMRFVIEYCRKLKAVVCYGCLNVVPHFLVVKDRPNLKVHCDTPLLWPQLIVPRINV